MMRVLDIIDGTTVDGPGFRTAIYFAGCKHHCPGCHNPSSWDMNGGTEMSIEQIMEHVIENDFNVTFSGGDPMYQACEILPLAKAIHKAGKNIWCYTGFCYEQILEHKDMSALLNEVDVLVDGEFILILRNTSIPFKGSDNQRIIDLQKSIPNNIYLWESDF